MKYKILTQIGNFLTKFSQISSAKRISDRVVMIEFNKEWSIMFDMDKTNSSIYIDKNFIQTKEYKAPFDVLLAKRFNSSKLERVEVLENNRILLLQASRSGSYKKLTTNIYFEFTGRFTNIVISDEEEVILEALSHYENQKRTIKTGHVYETLLPIKIKEGDSEEIEDFGVYFKQEFDRINSKKLENLRDSKLIQIDKKLENLRQNLDELESKETLLNKAEISAKKAKLLTANLHSLKEYQREFTLTNFDGESIDFKLNDLPKFEAKKLFDESKKLKQKALGIGLEEENLKEKLEFYESLKEMIIHASSLSELEILTPKKGGKKTYEKEHDNIENFYINEYKISVGKNEKGNEILLKNSKKNDFWFHLKNAPSAHVIVKTNKQNLTSDVINFAAKVCINFSVKNAGRYEVDFTKRSNVKVRDKAFVNYTNYDTITLIKP
ncbi:MAG: DUF814 domain-containing protein [Campylobacter sp.]|nr:DUF814 domain-containing protein [Campylobacter sp.]